MSVTPRVLLSIDYEPVFALFRYYDGLSDSRQRRALDHGFTLHALDSILEHCHIHRPLVNVQELAEDLRVSAPWCKEYHVRGYRAPMVGIREAAYQLLEEAGFLYSSSIYAPAGVLLQKGNVWEIPVSTLSVREKNGTYTAPRDFSFKLLLGGELPYGSSFSIGLMGKRILKTIEQELKRGLSPVIIFHPYELVAPAASARLTRDLILHPLFLPFLRNKSALLSELLCSFPVSPLGTYLDENLVSMRS